MSLAVDLGVESPISGPGCRESRFRDCRQPVLVVTRFPRSFGRPRRGIPGEPAADLPPLEVKSTADVRRFAVDGPRLLARTLQDRSLNGADVFGSRDFASVLLLKRGRARMRAGGQGVASAKRPRSARPADTNLDQHVSVRRTTSPRSSG